MNIYKILWVWKEFNERRKILSPISQTGSHGLEKLEDKETWRKAGETAPPLRAFAVLTENPLLTQWILTVIPVLENLTPSSSLYGHYKHVIHKHTCRHNIYTHKVKINLKKFKNCKLGGSDACLQSQKKLWRRPTWECNLVERALVLHAWSYGSVVNIGYYSAWEAEAGGSELKIILDYTVSLRPVWATWD